MFKIFFILHETDLSFQLVNFLWNGGSNNMTCACRVPVLKTDIIDNKNV